MYMRTDCKYTSCFVAAMKTITVEANQLKIDKKCLSGLCSVNTEDTDCNISKCEKNTKGQRRTG